MAAFVGLAKTGYGIAVAGVASTKSIRDVLWFRNVLGDSPAFLGQEVIGHTPLG